MLVSQETAKLTADLAAAGMRVIQTRHEYAAIGMAYGWSRSTGTTGVALIRLGPGL